MSMYGPRAIEGMGLVTQEEDTSLLALCRVFLLVLRRRSRFKRNPFGEAEVPSSA